MLSDRRSGSAFNRFPNGFHVRDLPVGAQIQSTMKKDKKKRKSTSTHSNGIDFPDYPLYPHSEDIYSQFKEEDINLDTHIQELLEKQGNINEKDFAEDLTGSDLDIPGAELDDEQENIGSEDEENNYYSLGGDNHEDLEEDKGG